MLLAARVALFFVSFLWGISFVFTKRYLEVIDPIAFTAYTFLISGGFFYVLTLLRGKRIAFRFREGLLLGILIYFLEVPQTIGLSQTTAANTAFITAIGVLFIPFLTYLLYRHPIHVSTWVALPIAFVGVNLLTGGIREFNQGDLWVVLAAIGCLFYIVFTEHFEKERGADLFALCAQQFLVVGVVSLSTAVIAGSELGLRSADASWVPLIWLTVLFTLIPYLLLQFAERFADEVDTTFYGVLEPLVGGAAAWTIGAEAVTSAMLFGGILIVVALIISEYHRPSIAHIKRHAKTRHWR